MTLDCESNTIRGTFQEFEELMVFIKQVMMHSGYTKYEFFDRFGQCITLRIEEVK